MYTSLASTHQGPPLPPPHVRIRTNSRHFHTAAIIPDGTQLTCPRACAATRVGLRVCCGRRVHWPAAVCQGGVTLWCLRVPFLALHGVPGCVRCVFFFSTVGSVVSCASDSACLWPWVSWHAYGACLGFASVTSQGCVWVWPDVSMCVCTHTRAYAQGELLCVSVLLAFWKEVRGASVVA